MLDVGWRAAFLRYNEFDGVFEIRFVRTIFDDGARYYILNQLLLFHVPVFNGEIERMAALLHLLIQEMQFNHFELGD